MLVTEWALGEGNGWGEGGLQFGNVLVEVFEVFGPCQGDGKDTVHQNQGI